MAYILASPKSTKRKKAKNYPSELTLPPLEVPAREQELYFEIMYEFYNLGK